MRPFGRSLFGGGLGLDNNLRVESIDYQARLVFTTPGSPSTTYRLATTKMLRDGEWHDPALLLEGLEPEVSFPDDFGIVEGDEIEATLVGDYKALLDEDLDGTTAELEILSILHRSDGSTLTQGNTKTLTIQGTSMDVGEVRLNLVSLEDVKLDQVYPSTEYTVDDYGEIFEEHVGDPVCKVVGLGIKTPGTIIKTGGGTGPWRIAFCETGPAAVKASGSDDGILTAYRSNRVIDSSEYSVVEDTSGTKDLLCIEFTDEADVIDFQGNYHDFHADIRDTTSVDRNMAAECKRTLQQAGVSVDTSSFDEGETYAADEFMLMDYVYGRDGQRTFKAHLEDQLFVLRGGLKRDPSGNYVLFQDKEGGSATRYDEDIGHPVEFTNYERPPRHTSIALSYKPSIQDTGKLRHTITRSVTGGTLGDAKPREIPQLMDHTAAGKLADYLAKREQYNRRIEIYTAQDQFEPTKLIGGKNQNLWTDEKLWQVRSASLVPAGSSVTAWEYNGEVYNTSAGTPPSDATTGYQPDYSNTPPDAPTINDPVDDSGAEVNDDGGVTSWAKVSATPPATNFQRMIFQAVNDSTGEVITEEGSEISGGDWETTFASLRPNANYTIFAFGRNKFGVDGATDSLSHGTATDVGAPTKPSTPSLSQIPVSRWMRAVVVSATPNDFSHVEWQKETNSGSWTDQPEMDGFREEIPGNYGASYRVRCRYVDTSGNASDWSDASSSVTPARNTGTDDLVDSAVTTSRIATSAVETDRIAAGNVTTDRIADSAVQTAKINDTDVTTVKRQGLNSVSRSGTISDGNWKDSWSIGTSQDARPSAAVYCLGQAFAAFRSLSKSITYNFNGESYRETFDSTSGDISYTVTIYFW